MGANDVGLAVLQMGPYTIPLAGEEGGSFYEITPDPIATVDIALSGEGVSNKKKGGRATIVVSARPHEPAHKVLRRIALAQKATPGGVPLPGAALDASSAQVATWEGGAMTQEPNMRAGEESAVATATFVVWGYDAVQS